MSANKPNSFITSNKLVITAIFTIFVGSLLLWEQFHGGVVSHHILNRKNLPEISNWWGILLIPALTWFLLGRIEKRINIEIFLSQSVDSQDVKVFKFFFAGLLMGMIVAVSFTNDYKIILDKIPFIFLILSLIIPIFYAEFILGFVLAMSYTFGAILPTAFILVMAAMGYLIYRFVRPLLLKLTNLFSK